MTRVDAAGLRRARDAALQMLYQWEVGRVGAHEAIVTYWRRVRASPDEDLRESRCATSPNDLVNGTVEAASQEIDALLAAHAQNWRVERMAVLDRLVLRLAVFELLDRPGHAGEGRHQRGARARARVHRRRGRRLRQRHPRRGEEASGPRVAPSPTGARPGETGSDAHVGRSTRAGHGINRTCQIDQHEQRRANFEELERLGVDPVPARLRPHPHGRTPWCRSVRRARRARSSRPPKIETTTAGRILAMRSFGKANFLVISDGASRIQVYIRQDALPERDFQIFKLLDFGDFVGVRGTCSAPGPTS